MIGAALALVRSSLPSILVLAAALFVMTNLLSGEQSVSDRDTAGAIPSLAPLPVLPRRTASAVAQSALFDPGRRAETISGSIDDLRSGAVATSAPVTIAGVLLAAGSQKAMLSLGGAAPAWSGVGAELGGWRVTAIDPDGAVIERDGQSVTLKVADRYKLHSKLQADAGEPRSAPDPDGGATPPSPPEPVDASPPPTP